MTNREALAQIESALEGARKVDSPTSMRWAAALEVAAASIRTSQALEKAGIRVTKYEDSAR
jgi:hypothetical protein